MTGSGSTSGGTSERRTGSGPDRSGYLARLAPLLLVLLAALPALGGIVGLLLDGSRSYLPYGDQAVLELNVRDVGDKEVLLGPYSRFGWYHPGPLGVYLLAAPYRLLGGASESLSIGALLLAGVSLVGCVLLVRRRAGTAAALWSLGVLAVSVRVLGPEFLRDSWNPLLPILPFLLAVLLCWSALAGDRWALPLATVPASLALQSHIGFLPPVAAVGAVTAAGLVLAAVRARRVRRARGVQGAQGAPTDRTGRRRWLVALGATVAVPVVLWLPPLVQQLTGSPGNVSAILRYLRTSHPQGSLGTGLRGVADEFGKLPSYLLGLEPPERVLLPETYPVPAIVLGLAVFTLTVAVAAHRRRTHVLWLATYTVALAAAAVAAISRIEGPPFFYVTRWTSVVGMLAGITIGLGLLPEAVLLLRRASARRPTVRISPQTLVTVPLALLATVAVAVTAAGTARAETPQTDYSGEIPALAGAVVADLDRLGIPRETENRGAVVRVDFAPTTRQVLVGTSFEGSGLVLALVRDGFDAEVAPFWELPFGAKRTDRAALARYVVTIAYSDGSSPPPEPNQRVLAVAGEYQVYGGPLPAR